MNLVGAVPVYQESGTCNNDKVTGLEYSSTTCGINFNFTHWNEPQVITVRGKSDKIVNVRPRIMNLRMYVNARIGSDDANLDFWRGYMLPDLKVRYQANRLLL